MRLEPWRPVPLTIRVDRPPTVIGTAAEPAVVGVPTGVAGERLEAQLLIVHGIVTSKPVRSTAGNVAFSVDDGSGPLRVTVFSASGIGTAGLDRGTSVVLRGVLGQQTTGQQPDRGYRLWPRDSADLQVLAATSSAAGTGGGAIGSGVIRDVNAASGASGQAALPDLGGEVEDAASGSGGASTSANGGDTAHAPGITAGDRASGIGSADGGGSSSSEPIGANGASLIEPMAARSAQSRYASVLLLTALALVVLLGMLAWRTGAFGRLRTLAERLAVGETFATAPASGLDPAPAWTVTGREGGEPLT